MTFFISVEYRLGVEELQVTKEEAYTAILTDVVQRFTSAKKSTSRRDLIIKYKAAGTTAIMDLVNRNVLRSINEGEEQYLPTAAAFQFCGDVKLRHRARTGVTAALHALQNMYVAEPPQKQFTFQDLRRYVDEIGPNHVSDETLNLGLYLVREFNVLAGYQVSPTDYTETAWFRVGEGAVTIEDVDQQWDVATAPYRPVHSSATPGDIQKIERKLQAVEMEWEKVRPLGEGGQSNVFLVRNPKRAFEREACLQRIRTALDGDKRAEFAEAIWSYVRPDEPSELGALKVFKISPEDARKLSPLPGSEDYRAVERLKNEIEVLSQNRPGLPRLLHSDVAKRRIVTEYFERGGLEKHLLKYKGDAPRALGAFRSLVETVASLHREGYVHRDIKPANIFLRDDGTLVLGDFGIVYMPGQPERVTFTEERVGPRDYMPQWGDLGERLENVQPNFDVYMLGKLLWCMVSGRPKLPREYHGKKGFSLTELFPGNPDMHLVKQILDRCVVEEPETCLKSAEDLLPLVDESLATIRLGGQLLHDGVPRPCHICGKGTYKFMELRKGNPTVVMRFWMASGGAADMELLAVRPFVCGACGHIELFRE